MTYTRITVYITDKIPTHCIIGKKVCQFHQSDGGEHDDEYYCEDGEWGVFTYTNGHDTWVQRLIGGTWESYKPTHKTLTIVRQETT
jgi:hypothetical protein